MRSWNRRVPGLGPSEEPAKPEPQPIVASTDPFAGLVACKTRAEADRWLKRLRDERPEFSKRGRDDEWRKLREAAKKLRKELP
jgi:hypothetical protein